MTITVERKIGTTVQFMQDGTQQVLADKTDLARLNALTDAEIEAAEAQRDSLAQVLEGQIATKSDLLKFELKLIEHDGEFKLVKLMLGIILGGVLALVLKAIFPFI